MAERRHGVYLDGETHGWFLRIEGWRQLVLLLLGLGCCYASGVLVGVAL